MYTFVPCNQHPAAALQKLPMFILDLSVEKVKLTWLINSNPHMNNIFKIQLVVFPYCDLN